MFSVAAIISAMAIAPIPKPIEKQLELLAWIDLLVQRDSQFLIATHSPMLMAFPGAQVFQLSELGIEEVPYQETDHFQLMRAFLNCPDRLLHLLC